METVSSRRPSKRAILYYPTIDIPTDSWLRHAVLYWDEVSSIIPKDHDGNLMRALSPEVKYLISEGEFQPVHPEQLMSGRGNWNALQKFESEFNEIIDNPLYIFFVRQNYYGLYRGKSNLKYWSEIHRNKTSDSLFYNLKDKGLAKEAEGPWVKFESNTALLYMSLLAKYLAEIQNGSTVIGTDLGVYESLNFKPVGRNEGVPIVSYRLSNLLPVAETNVPFEKILSYKRNRNDNLLRFRKILNAYQKKISKADSIQEVKEVSLDFSEELQIGLNDLEATLKDAKISTRSKTIRTLVNFQTPTSIIAAAGFLNMLPASSAIPLTVVSGLFEISFSCIENRIQERGIIRDSDFSYVYEAQRAGILKRTT